MGKLEREYMTRREDKPTKEKESRMQAKLEHSKHFLSFCPKRKKFLLKGGIRAHESISENLELLGTRPTQVRGWNGGGKGKAGTRKGEIVHKNGNAC